ncbi:MAG: hypothetical protein KME18_09270 [Phormidium tanganyikae FI6-MK23]|jgi:hypothetical protein|nr:hypothetical protein [Phormidium tanganyikae FI6-MK23]
MNEQMPYYQAVGVLQGILSQTEDGLSMTIGETKVRATARASLKFWLGTDGKQYLDSVQNWRCYPRTTKDGQISKVQLVGLASDEPSIVQISGRAIESDGIIKVWIHRNDPKNLERSKSFYLTLNGALGIQTGAFVRITAIVNNGFLLVISGETLANAPKPVRKGKKPIIKSNTKVTSEREQKRKLSYAVG